MQVAKTGRTILVVEDEMEVRGYLEMALRCLGHVVELAQDGEEALEYLRTSKGEVAAILLDIMMPNRGGMQVLQEIRRLNPRVPVIMVSGASSTLNVVAAMKSGAADFLCKPVAHEDLRKAIARALEVPPAQRFRPVRVAEPTARYFMGEDVRMKEIQSLVEQIGWSEAPVLIQGETGCGKEVIARELHVQSPRANKPFLKLNCAALPSELVESELFGYERGAFTGAFQKKAGMFEQADQGTILLDEIGDMDVRLQAKLLQVLQDHEFQRIGGTETIKVDVRIMAATHRDLEKAIVDRTFREDLFYRLNVINLVLPPLRERPADILPMAEFLLQKHAVQGMSAPPLTSDLTHAMIAYHWPGNVRELENLIRKLIVLRNPAAIARELMAKASMKSLRTLTAAAPPTPEAPSSPILAQVTKAKQVAETDVILAALNTTRWNRKQAALLLKIDYKALLYKMKKLGVENRPVQFPTPLEVDTPLTKAAHRM